MGLAPLGYLGFRGDGGYKGVCKSEVHYGKSLVAPCFRESEFCH